MNWLCLLWVRRSKRRPAVGFPADTRRREFSLVAVVGLRRILRSWFWDNKLHGIANQNELRARCDLIIPGLGAQAALHHDHVSFLVTRQRVCPGSKTLAHDKRGFFLVDLRFVAVATIARDVKESHLGAIVSNNGARTSRHISTVTFRFDMLF